MGSSSPESVSALATVAAGALASARGPISSVAPRVQVKADDSGRPKTAQTEDISASPAPPVRTADRGASKRQRHDSPPEDETFAIALCRQRARRDIINPAAGVMPAPSKVDDGRWECYNLLKNECVSSDIVAFKQEPATLFSTAGAAAAARLPDFAYLNTSEERDRCVFVECDDTEPRRGPEELARMINMTRRCLHARVVWLRCVPPSAPRPGVPPPNRMQWIKQVVERVKEELNAAPSEDQLTVHYVDYDADVATMVGDLQRVTRIRCIG